MAEQLMVDTGYKPHHWQKEIHQHMKRFNVLVCHRRFGKTFLSVNSLIDAALRTSHKDARYGYVAPFLKQGKQIAWTYLKRFASAVPNVTIHESDLYVQFPNGARVTIYGADNKEALRGLYFNGIVLDEVADMKPDVWEEILRPTLSDYKGWALFIGTPKGINLFYELYQYAQTDNQWYSGIYRADETDIIDDEEMESIRRGMSDAAFRQEYLCDFTAASDNVLITIDRVTDASKREMRDVSLEGLPVILGVDVARFGDDKSVIMKRIGLQAFAPRIFDSIDNMQFAGVIAQEIDECKADSVFIDGGRGEGVIDRLRQLGYSVVEVNFGGKPIDTHYVNKRSEMWDKVNKWLNEGGCIPNHSKLKTELCIPTYSFDAQNRLKLESKDNIKARGLSSPDLADALALTFAFPVHTKTISTTNNSVLSEYDPYG